MGVNALLNIGNNALNATQVAINVTGNNIANVNTEGYSRQNVRFEEYAPMNFRPGQLGMGAYAAEITRQFNRFVENSFLDRYAFQNRWEEQQLVLSSAESLFNESNRVGINSSMSIFFQDWQQLSQRPDDMAVREALLADANNLTRMIRDTQNSLDAMQNEMDTYIQHSVSRANDLLDAIAKVNLQISSTHTADSNNPNALYDQRDKLTRELATLVDVDIIDRGKGDFTIQTKHGDTLVQGDVAFKLAVLGPRSERNLTVNSAYQGDVIFSGQDSQEYTLEMVRGGNAGDDPPPAFRVSLDGGKTWLRNDDGTELQVPVLDTDLSTSETIRTRVKNLDISFSENTNFSVGDRFQIVPKSGLYWVTPTRPPLNITPQVLSDGTDNTDRLVGGKLTSYFTVRDYNIGRYKDKMDAMANALIWEVNQVHSQGGGAKNLTATLGSYGVDFTDQALGLSDTGLEFSNRLKTNNINFTMFDSQGNSLGIQALDFSFTPPGSGSFDPAVHTLEDVVQAINNNQFGNPPQSVQASIVNGRLSLNAPAGMSFAISSDTSGLAAALGINTFFNGSSAGDISIKEDIMQDASYINAGSINADGTITAGDNKTARAIADLSSKDVKISTTWENSTQSLINYHAGAVGLVGSDMRNVKFNAEYNRTLANELDERSSAISGVNLDEEMTSLIKFQHSYTAAAKLITTADQMLQTVLGLKQ